MCVCVPIFCKCLFLINFFCLIPKNTMKIRRTRYSILLKAGALLAVSVMAWISLTSACDSCNPTPGNVCFTFSSTCPFPPGTQLCMTKQDCGIILGGQGMLTPVETQCCTAGGSSPSTVTGNFNPYNINVTAEWASFTPPATTCAQAEADLTAEMAAKGFTLVSGSLSCATAIAPGTVCFQKFTESCADPVDGSDVYPEGSRFTGYLQCPPPGGKIIPVSPISYDEQYGVSGCQDTYLSVHLPNTPPCPTCN